MKCFVRWAALAAGGAGVASGGVADGRKGGGYGEKARGGVLGRGKMVERDGGGDGVQRECMDSKEDVVQRM